MSALVLQILLLITVIHQYLYLETVHFNKLEIETFRTCKIPHQSESSACVAVSECSAYLEVRNVSELTAERVNFLKNIQCPDSIRDLESTVCCPVQGQGYREPLLKFTQIARQNISASAKKKKLKRRIYAGDQLNACGKQVTQRIYGGEIAELNEFPWLALLIYNTSMSKFNKGLPTPLQHIFNIATTKKERTKAQ